MVYDFESQESWGGCPRCDGALALSPVSAALERPAANIERCELTRRERLTSDGRPWASARAAPSLRRPARPTSPGTRPARIRREDRGASLFADGSVWRKARFHAATGPIRQGHRRRPRTVRPRGGVRLPAVALAGATWRRDRPCGASRPHQLRGRRRRGRRRGRRLSHQQSRRLTGCHQPHRTPHLITARPEVDAVAREAIGRLIVCLDHQLVERAVERVFGGFVVAHGELLYPCPAMRSGSSKSWSRMVDPGSSFSGKMIRSPSGRRVQLGTSSPSAQSRAARASSCAFL